jgi:hypothetical protein
MTPVPAGAVGTRERTSEVGGCMFFVFVLLMLVVGLGLLFMYLLLVMPSHLMSNAFPKEKPSWRMVLSKNPAHSELLTIYFGVRIFFWSAVVLAGLSALYKFELV